MLVFPAQLFNSGGIPHRRIKLIVREGVKDMCLALPMKVKSIKSGYAEVETGKLIRTINIQMLPQAKVGDYVIVHAGFAIQKVDPERAAQTLRLIDEIY